MTQLPNSPWLLTSLGCALLTVLCFAVNLFWYRAPRDRQAIPASPVSVLIPARNEEAGILAAVHSVLASTGVQFELLVLDDASLDNTASVVAQAALLDPRLHLHSAPPLPAGWNGKQHACATLARLAAHPVLCFLDADVRLEPHALHSLLLELEAGRADLLSGFPLEQTGTWLEKLLLPLIHFVLLCYLPLPLMRIFPRVPGFAAGCGQLMLVRRAAYEASRGHAAIRETMHDGIRLPRLLRRHGFRTGLVDLTHLARCRMYRGTAEVWHGLGKNATEGMAAPARILPFTFLLFFGHVLPTLWLGYCLFTRAPFFWAAMAVAAGYLVRAVAAWRFHQSLLGAALHPAAVLTLLTLQWWALGRKLLGRQTIWKQREYDLG